jgi:hypothetical protein
MCKLRRNLSVVNKAAGVNALKLFSSSLTKNGQITQEHLSLHKIFAGNARQRQAPALLPSVRLG